jgi:hypothetical protein
MAVVAPMPSASVSTATRVKTGLFQSCRPAKRRSWPSSANLSIHFICLSLPASTAQQYLRVPSRSPKRRRASTRASSRGHPAAISSAVTMSRWKPSSSSTSAATWTGVRRGKRKARRPGMDQAVSSTLETAVT